MTPVQLAERKALLAAVVAKTKARLAEAMAGFKPGTPTHSALGDADVQITQLLQRCNVLADGLLPYTDPDFYVEMRPSRAADDLGVFAAAKLEQAFPE